jgi:NAD(P)-dependent dehydrogenase (short-subunit alcohol dehydrogenase family)
MERRFDGRRAIVTGAAHGIGEATAQRLALEGAHVVCVDVDERGEEVAAGIRARSGSATFARCDIGIAEEVEAVVRDASRAGPVGVLVNNAAITLPKGFEQTSPSEWDRVLRVNLGSVHAFCRAAAQGLRASGHGAVVNVSSFHAQATIESFGAYAASKAGVAGLTRSVALDLAPSGVRANAICPGIVATAMWDAWIASAEDPEQVIRDVSAYQPLGRIGRPEEIAAAIAFLASDEASFITGTTLYADGGVTARLHHV